MKKKILALLLLTVTAYIIGSFLAASFSVKEWHIAQRIIMAFLFVIGIIIISIEVE